MSRVGVYWKNGLGNAVMLTPAIQSMRALWPGCSIEILIDAAPVEGEVPGRWGAVEDLWHGYRAAGVVDSVRCFSAPQAIDLGAWDHVAVYRHGEHGWLSAALREHPGVIDSPPWQPAFECHEVLYYLEALRRLGYRGPTPPLARLPVVDVPIAGRYVASCNGSLDAPEWIRKRLPTATFERLVRTLGRWAGLPVVIVGGRSEQAEAEAISSRVLEAFSFAGCASIGETATILAGAELVVSTDTACMHLAAAAGVPTVSLFGPTQAWKTHPWTGAPWEVVARALPCRPCRNTVGWVECRDNVCLSGLEVGDVMGAVRRVEGKHRARSAPISVGAPA